MAPQKIKPSSNGISTSKSSKQFYEAVRALDRKLGGKIPVRPADYRLDIRNTADSSDYTLFFHEELDLADDFAFLAAVKGDDPDYVSATVVEEQRNPPGLIIRLASNKTPKPRVVDSLRRVIGTIQDHARSDDRKLDKWILFDEIIEFSEERIYSRLRSAQWKPPGRYGKKPRPALHARIHQKLASVWKSVFSREGNTSRLQKELLQLIAALQELDGSPETVRVSKLKEIIRQCHSISYCDAFNSLEKRFQHLGLSEKDSQDSVIRQIDKLSKYWQICLDLVQHSRRSRTRELFRNFRLEPITAPSSGQPFGSNERCFVHGEVQLVLYYVMYRIEFPPRAIGSSKSACFLCDQFVTRHGKFQISHSHMRLYSQWMVPDSEWMSPEQRNVFRAIMKDMIAEMTRLARLAKAGVYIGNDRAESKANVWQRREESSSTSSALCTVIEETAPLMLPTDRERRSSSSSSSSICPEYQSEDDTRTATPRQNLTIQEPIAVGKRKEKNPKIEQGEEDSPPQTSTPTQSNKSPSPTTSSKRDQGGSRTELKLKKSVTLLSTPTDSSNTDEGDSQSEPGETTRPLSTKTPIPYIPVEQPSVIGENDTGENKIDRDEEEPTSPSNIIIPIQSHPVKPSILPTEHMERNEEEENPGSSSEEAASATSTISTALYSLAQQSARGSNLAVKKDNISSTAKNKVAPSQMWLQFHNANRQQKYKKVGRRAAYQTSNPPLESPDHEDQEHSDSQNQVKVQQAEGMQNQDSRPPSLLESVSEEQEDKQEEQEKQQPPSPPKTPSPTTPSHHTTHPFSPQHPQQPQTPKQEQIYTLTSLPLKISIHPSTKTFTLLISSLHEPKIEYLFDTSLLSHGTIEISASKVRKEMKRIYVDDMSENEEVKLEMEPSGVDRKLEFGIASGRKDCVDLNVVITWGDGLKSLVKGQVVSRVV